MSSMPTPAEVLRSALDVYPDHPYITVDRRDLERVLQDRAALLEVSSGYCPTCGRGDASPTADQYLAQVHRAEAAEERLVNLRAVIGHIISLLGPLKE